MFTTAKTQLKAENKELRDRIAELEKALAKAQLGEPHIRPEDGLNFDFSQFSAVSLESTQSEDLFWATFDRAAIGIAKIHPETCHILRTNPAFKDMLGFTQDYGGDLSLEDITHPEDISICSAQLDRVANNEIDSFLIEKRYIKNNGDVMWSRTTLSRFYDISGENDSLLAFIENISQSKEAERALRESEERFDLAVKGSNDGLWDWMDIENDVIWMSPRLYELLGYGPDDTLPTLSEFRSWLHPDDIERVEQHLIMHLKNHESYDINCRMMNGRGKYKWFRVRGQAIWNDKGRATRMAGSLTDISSQKSHEEELERYAEELRKAKEKAEVGTRAKSEFLANMSHEIRTPMNGILGYAEILLDTELSVEQREFINIVHNNGRRLLNLLDSILDVSKIESGQIEVIRRPFNLRTLIDNTIETIKPASTEKGLELKCHVEQALPNILTGDEIRLSQIFVNLLSNAVKFTDRGSVELSVNSSRLEEDKIWVHFIVTDTGIGISPDDKEFIFEKFAQLDNSATRRYSGSGLGLAISHKLVEQMGGKMWVESEKGMGSLFHINVPLGLEKQVPDIALKREHANLDQLQVLFAVDNALNEQRLNRQLKAWGMEVLPVRNASDAEDALQSLERVDLCLIDVEGDNAGGLSVARQIRELTGPSLPIVLFSDDGRHYYEPHIVSLSIVKPTSGLQLYRLLSALVKKTIQDDGPQQTEKTHSSNEQSYRILLVEDEADNQKLALHFLEKLGYEVTLATNGLEAIWAFDKAFYDIVLMDIQMPEMDGQAATAHLRSSGYMTGNPWIVAVTARAMTGDKEKFLEAGMDDYLSKPYSKDGLITVLENAKKQIEKIRSNSGEDLLEKMA